MAKSIRSKWKRKCRAIKRERYAVKELARLKKTLGIAEDLPKSESSQNMDVDGTAPKDAKVDEQVIFLDAGQISNKRKDKNKKQEAAKEAEDSDEVMSSDDECVEVEENGKKRVFSSKTMKDQNGQYPRWLHKRKIAKMTNKVKKNMKKKRSKKRKH